MPSYRDFPLLREPLPGTTVHTFPALYGVLAEIEALRLEPLEVGSLPRR
jgi:hypothetical protein